MNYALIIYEGKYPMEKGSMVTLLGIYPNKEDAVFIKEKFEQKFGKISKIEKTSAPITTNLVSHFLKLGFKRY